jgi:hypothetical protein
VVFDKQEYAVPAIVVHIDGRRHDHDADAHLRLEEAVELRRLLDDAIRIVGNATEPK